MATVGPFFVEKGAPAVRVVSGLTADVTALEGVLRVYGEDVTATPVLEVTCSAGPTPASSKTVAFTEEQIDALGPGGFACEFVLRDATTHEAIADGAWHGALYVNGPGFPEVSAV